MKPKNCKRAGIHSLVLATAAALSLAVSFNTAAAPDEKAAGKAPPPPPPTKTGPSKTTAVEPKGGGVAKGAATGVAATALQLCSTGFTKISEKRHASHNGIEYYSCSAPIPACSAQKTAASNAAGNPLPSRLQGVTKATGGAAGTMEGSHSFKIETKYEVGYDYSCDVIASCIAPAVNNNANGHSESVHLLGNNVVYKCTYFWVQG